MPHTGAVVTVEADERTLDEELPPRALATLVERFDPDVIDVPSGTARIRLVVEGDGEWDALIERGAIGLELAEDEEPDAVLSADSAAWELIARDVRGGMDAFRARRLSVRQNLHLGVGFLAATSDLADDRRLRFDSFDSRHGRISTLSAGEGDPVICVHGLGGTKASFLTTVAALADRHRVVALDLPGFGDSDKPIAARYDPKFFSRAVIALMDALELDHTDVVGHSLGGRVTLEAMLHAPERFGRAVLMTPSLAWLRERPWAPFLRLVRPELGLLHPAPRAVVERVVAQLVPGGSSRYAAAGIDEFLRSYLTARGRAAFYASARHIYLERPEHFWERLRRLEPPALFVWGSRDPLVPAGFERHVREAVPQARHVTLDCGHIPQIERPDELHRAIAHFLRS